MKKLLAIILKLASVLFGIISIGLAILLINLIKDVDGPYSETPFIIGYFILGLILTVVIWDLSSNLNSYSFLLRLAIITASISMFYVFTPVATLRNMLWMTKNTGNIFTFKTDSSYSNLVGSEIYDDILQIYHHHILIVLILILVTGILIFVGLSLKKTSRIS